MSHLDMSGVIRGSGDQNSQGPMSVVYTGNTSSSLKVFGQAKKKINELFVSMSSYIEESDEFMKDMKENASIVSAEQVNQLEKYKEKVSAIREILQRDRMKVVFFGRTSNGKSTVINTMLRKKILPSGLGHTTNCFLQVEGVDDNEPYTVSEDEPDKRNYGLGEINNMANAVDNEIATSDNLIRICWPKEMCSLLKEDMVLVDSPGTDVDPNLDKWIEKFCLDADVFVLVVNGASTVTQTEKGFFHKVSERLSKPNIFILYNRWDEAAREMEMMPKVKKQHMTRSTDFLCKELGVIPVHEVENRVFFVSARETLNIRVHQDKGTPTPSMELSEGFQGRSFEFENFEKKFEGCISQSAVETKFALHAEKGKDIMQAMIKTLNEVCRDASNKRETLEVEHREQSRHLEVTQRQMNDINVNIHEKIQRMTEEVEIKVGSALIEEINKLRYLINGFELPFTSRPTELHEYKKKLNAHVESTIVNRVQNGCTEVLRSSLEKTETEIADQLLTLIPDDVRRNSLVNTTATNFQMLYKLDCMHLCKDFQEDLEFQFSYGLAGIIKRFASRRQSKMTIPRPMSGEEHYAPSLLPPALVDNVDAMAGFTALISLTSRTTVGMLVLAGLLIRSIGWKVIAGLGACYGGVYLLERLQWTDKAKEEEFKKQYIDYVTGKLRMAVHFTSTNCSTQVNTQLTSNFRKLCEQVNSSRSDLQNNLKQIKSEIAILEDASIKSNILKNKAQFAESDLNRFMTQYLKSKNSQ